MRINTIVAAIMAFSVTALEAREVWQGWMNLTPCSRVIWRNDGPFGLPAPTAETAPQELHGYLDLNIPDEQAIVDIAKSCAERGVAAASIAAVLTNWGGAWPAFKVEWDRCIASAPKAIVQNSFNFRTNTSCRW